MIKILFFAYDDVLFCDRFPEINLKRRNTISSEACAVFVQIYNMSSLKTSVKKNIQPNAAYSTVYLQNIFLLIVFLFIFVGVRCLENRKLFMIAPNYIKITDRKKILED